MLEHNLCKALGLDGRAIKDRLRLLELSSNDEATVEKLHRFVIHPNLNEIIDEFYEFVMAHQEYRVFVHDASVVSRLTRTFRIYLESLGVKFGSMDYFQDRLRVGIAHHRIGMSLILYQTAYRKMQQILLDKIPRELNSDLTCDLVSIVHKIVSLDISLAIDSYNLENVKDLKAEIKKHFDKEVQFKHFASIDPLTRIVNRGSLIDKLKTIMKDSSDTQTYAVLMIDINNLRDVNDRLGHLVGDFLIKKIVEKVKEVLPKGSLFGRYGGDEFMLIVKSISRQEAETLAASIDTIIGGEVFSIGKENLSVGLSQGVSLLDRDASLAENIKRVDRAMIDAKTSGQRIVVVGP